MNAHSKTQRPAGLSEEQFRLFGPDARPDTETDGSIVVSEEQLRRFGGGDANYGRRELRALLSKEPSGPEYDSQVTECPKSVRIALPRDEKACVDLWLMDLRDNAAHVAPIDPDKVTETIQCQTRSRGLVTVGVIDAPNGEGIVGLCVLAALQWHWSRAWFYQEMCTFVHPEHRRSTHYASLLDFQKWVSCEMTRKFGYPVHILNGVLGTWRVHGKIAVYRRKFRQVGAAFIYPPPKMAGN